jgi:hypothetical protein
VQEELRDLTALWAAWRQHDLQEAAQNAPTPAGEYPALPVLSHSFCGRNVTLLVVDVVAHCQTSHASTGASSAYK